GRRSDVATKFTIGDIFLNAAASSLVNFALQSCASGNRNDVTKSVRFRSSMYLWSGAKPRGGRLSDPPSIGNFDLRSARHDDESAAIACRNFSSAGGSGCQMPAAANDDRKARAGNRRTPA